MGFPTVFFPVLFAIFQVLPTSGHAISQLFDLSVIQVHIGEWLRHYLPLKE
ncbi:putative citrate synthase [Rosa chinensis]|uniref:Putative citrate synthase n=1 Tax=Rosa chinensis TaxID=74649 RepID=A0A2P6RWL5_ROSCH|nr:putative citrate synthase [Rosa chinensis]